jgi:hypothetical protein
MDYEYHKKSLLNMAKISFVSVKIFHKIIDLNSKTVIIILG